MASNGVFVLPDPARPDNEWRVQYDGRIQRPMFNSRGAALAFLAGLEAGRKPEPVEYGAA